MVGKEVVLPEGVWKGFWKEVGLGLVNLGVRMGILERKQQCLSSGL